MKLFLAVLLLSSVVMAQKSQLEKQAGGDGKYGGGIGMGAVLDSSKQFEDACKALNWAQSFPAINDGPTKWESAAKTYREFIQDAKKFQRENCKHIGEGGPSFGKYVKNSEDNCRSSCLASRGEKAHCAQICSNQTLIFNSFVQGYTTANKNCGGGMMGGGMDSKEIFLKGMETNPPRPAESHK